MKPHKHAELIKAWADGAEIEFQDSEGVWGVGIPHWHPDAEYRIKPEPSPDVVRFLYADLENEGIYKLSKQNSNIKLTFDGETGELKSAEVVK